MKNVTFFLFLLISLNCSNSGSNTVKTQNTVIIYCDFTSSLNKSDSDEVLINIIEIVKDIEIASFVELYPIGVDMSRKAFFNRQLPVTKGSNSFEKKKYKDKMTSFIEDIEVAFKTTLENSRQSKQNQTCIINTFEDAFYRISSFNSDDINHTFQLFYISDFLEDCSKIGSEGSKIYMCPSKGKVDLQKILEKIEKDYNPTFNLSNLLNDKVGIKIVNSEDNDRCLSIPQRRKIWEKVWKKLGFKNDIIMSS